MISKMCALAMTWMTVFSPEREAVCQEVAKAAADKGVDPAFAVALSFTESRFSMEARSAAGAVGPLQILPKYYCPNRTIKGCDLIDAGIGAIIRHEKRYGPRLSDVLCHWNSGNRCTARSKYFARKVLKRRRLLTKGQGDS